MELSTPLSEEDYAEIRQQVSRHPISAGGMSLSPAGQDEITDSTGTVWQRYRFDSTDADLPVRVEIYLAEFPQRLQICGAAFWTEEDAQAHTMIEPALASLSGQQAPAGAAEAAPAASESD